MANLTRRNNLVVEGDIFIQKNLKQFKTFFAVVDLSNEIKLNRIKSLSTEITKRDFDSFLKWEKNYLSRYSRESKFILFRCHNIYFLLNVFN